MTRLLTLYLLAQEADQRFGEALRRAYGRKAGDYRYQPDRQTAEIRALGETYQRAMEAWRAAAFNSNRRYS